MIYLPHSGLYHLRFCLPVFVFVFFLFKDPPIVQDHQPLVNVAEKTHNRFSIRVDHRLLNDTNGPVTHVGVLVANQSPGRCPPPLPIYSKSLFAIITLVSSPPESHHQGAV